MCAGCVCGFSFRCYAGYLTGFDGGCVDCGLCLLFRCLIQLVWVFSLVTYFVWLVVNLMLFVFFDCCFVMLNLCCRLVASVTCGLRVIAG